MNQYNHFTAAGPAPAQPDESIRAQPARIASTQIHVRFEASFDVMSAWASLEEAAPCSIYQTRAWLLPWIDAIAPAAGLKPVFIIVRSQTSEPLAMLCFGLRRIGPVKFVTFLGGKDSNFNLPLLRRGVHFTAKDWRRILSGAAALMGPHRPSAYLLLNQPGNWDGVINALSSVDAQPSPSPGVGTGLSSNAEAFFAGKLSKESRKKLRKKEARLASLGPLSYEIPVAQNDLAETLDAFFTQKNNRLNSQNIVSAFRDPAMRRFIETAGDNGPHGQGIEIHALRVGREIVSIYGGGSHGGSWSGMFNSFESRDEVARCSPGDLLLMAVITAQCQAGTHRLDLGIGEARYKSMFCGDVIPLFDSITGVTIPGRMIALIFRSGLHAKRFIKKHPVLLRLVRKIRSFYPHPWCR